MKVYQSQYYADECFALNANTLIDKAIELEYIGSTFGVYEEPSPFLCLIVKLL